MTIRIRNWAKWQSYRSDRGQPPWIKVHRSLMRHPEWVTLTDAQRGQLVGMWLLAADQDGVIPASPAMIRKLCYMDSEPDLQVFAELGFIELDANMTPERRQHDRPETETETETDKRQRKESGTTLTLAKVRGLYGYGDREGTDPLLLKAFDDQTERDRCVDIALARLDAEGKEYSGKFFRAILASVIAEQKNGDAATDLSHWED